MPHEFTVGDPVVTVTGFSDRSLVNCNLPVRIPNATPIPVEIRKWKGLSIDNVKSDLTKSILYGDLDWTTSVSVDELFDRYAAELTTLLDKHPPHCIKKRKKHILTPWFDDKCTAFMFLNGPMKTN